MAYFSYKRRSKVGLTGAQKKDVRFLIQAGLSGIPCMLFMTCHHLFPTPLVENLAGDWCVIIAPPIYLWFNSGIRSDWLELIGYKAAKRQFCEITSRIWAPRRTNDVAAMP